uniref:uncharacterized protein LOC105351668 n=1 Tax=Fragaria vesca subsp. vesca TaxID=101020 RepID=UPI0005C8A17C|nr:PREDICTED: uncharacterized protein LOC105351668 [Fragaria vesca subsp. vesca]
MWKPLLWERTTLPPSKPPPTPMTKGSSDKVKVNALMFLRRHIDPSLRWKYLQLKTPLELWDTLKGRFGNIHDTLLPELTIQWNEIRLFDYKRVNDFNKDMLCLKARLNFCVKELTEDDMIQKTLSTFPISALILANQYRLEYDNKRITTFNKLINLLQVAERHNEVLLNNNVRAEGTKKIPEANYGKVKGGKNPKVKGVGRADPYPRGNNAPRGKGKGAHGMGRGKGRGGPLNVWRIDGGAGPSGHGGAGPSGHGSKVQKPPKNPPVKRVGNEPCYRCGFTDHWYKDCQASNKVAAAYKRYRESKEQEAHYMEDGGPDPDVNLTIADFVGNKDPAQSLDASDFD